MRKINRRARFIMVTTDLLAGTCPADKGIVEHPRAARGAMNTKARRLPNWQPTYPGWHKGFPRAAREWKSQAK